MIDATRISATLHPNEKPSELLEYFVENSSDPTALIFDPFLGSGTTMVAAERTGRICYGVEIAEKYVSVCLQRLTDMHLTPRRVSE